MQGSDPCERDLSIWGVIEAIHLGDLDQGGYLEYKVHRAENGNVGNILVRRVEREEESQVKKTESNFPRYKILLEFLYDIRPGIRKLWLVWQIQPVDHFCKINI